MINLLKLCVPERSHTVKTAYCAVQLLGSHSSMLGTQTLLPSGEAGVPAQVPKEQAAL